jgi:hypothetical protein
VYLKAKYSKTIKTIFVSEKLANSKANASLFIFKTKISPVIA